LLNVVMDTLVLSAPFLPQQIITHTFSLPLDMTANPYSYIIEVQLYNTHDAESMNNSIQQTVESFGYPTVVLHPDTALCGSGSILLDAGSGADSYLWSGSATTQTLFVDTALSGGYGTFTYSVTVTTNGCSADDDVVITFTDCTSLDETSEMFSIFPNPAQDELHLMIQSECVNAELSICDLTGREVIRKSVAGQFETVINISFLPDGVYLLRLKSDTSNHTRQIVIQR